MLSDSPEKAGRPAISLKLGHPDSTTLATPELRSAMAVTMEAPDFYTGLHYGPEQGAESLVEFLVEKIGRDQGISIRPANIMLVAGSTYAVDMLARLYVKPSGVVLVEAPTYTDALHVFRDHGVELYSIPMDDDGLIVSALEERLAWLESNGTPPSFLYTIPTFHNPRGSILPEARRLEIIELALKHGFMIVEDDVYRDLSFNGPVPASFYALAHGKQVCSIGSFSKTLAPGFRLGWNVGPEEVIQNCVACGTTQMGGGASPFSAQIVARFCRNGDWEPHIQHLRSVYATRRDLMLAALERYMPSGITWTRPEGGFFIWLTLPPSLLAQDVQRVALEAGVSFATGDAFFLDPRDGQHHLRLAYSHAAPQDIEIAIHTLADVVNSLTAGRS